MREEQKKINGLTKNHYDEYFKALKLCPCTRKAMDKLHNETFGPTQSPRYPDDYYTDKNNRMQGKETGHLRYENGKMVFVHHIIITGE